MRQFERAVGETSLIARCDGSMSTQAEWLLRTIAKVLEATPFRDGMTVQVGWTRFSLRTQTGRVLICEPSFHGNPFTASNLDVTLSLAVLSAHDDMIQVLGVGPEPVSFHHSVLIERGCLSERRLFMKRQSAVEGDASGWYVGVFGQAMIPVEEVERVELIRSTELLRVRRPLVIPLFLPAGYSVAWDGDTITSREAATREERGTARAAEALDGAEKRLDAAWTQTASSALPS